MKSKATEPGFCRRPAYSLFVDQLSRLDDSPAALENAAIAISMHQLEDVEPAAVSRRLNALARDVCERVQIPDRKTMFAHLHAVLFEEAQFRGNEDDYFNPINSYLPATLETRRGLPITLSLLYHLIAGRLGLRTEGVNCPGHFLVAIELDQRPAYVDPFHRGRIVTRRDITRRVTPMMESPLTTNDRLFRRASSRDWIARMLQNLQNVFIREGRIQDFGAMLELREALMADRPRSS